MATINIFFDCFPCYFLSQNLSLNLESGNLARLADQQAPEVLPAPASPGPELQEFALAPGFPQLLGI